MMQTQVAIRLTGFQAREICIGHVQRNHENGYNDNMNEEGLCYY